MSPELREPLPDPIPPGTILRLVRSDEHTPVWKGMEGSVFRVEYYSRQDGLDVVWLIAEDGVERQTIDREYAIRYFEVLSLSDETDLYGDDKPPWGPLRKTRQL